mgnify:CR=1 FL=1
MKHADQAMYQAKALGRNRFCYFTATLQQQAQRHLALTRSKETALYITPPDPARGGQNRLRRSASTGTCTPS